MPDSSGQRPIDILTISIALWSQSIWDLIPRIALDISIILPFRSSNLGQDSLSAAKSQAERNSRDHETTERCYSQDIGFESLIFEYSGDLDPEGDRLLISFCRAIDDKLDRKIRSTCRRSTRYHVSQKNPSENLIKSFP